MDVATATQDKQTEMRAVRLYGPGLEPRVERVPAPRARPGQSLLRVLAAGVCHTELQLLDGTLNPGVWPLIPGHEIAGEVVEGPLAGQRALVYYSQPCGECEWCRGGQEQVCPNAGPQPGLSTDGGFAELVRVPNDCLIPLPDHLDPSTAAPLGCAAATALHAMRAVAEIKPGETVVVYGIGGVGLPLIQLARLAGARVLAIGRSSQKLELAQSLGAEVVDGSREQPDFAIRRLSRGEGAHAVFELVGNQDTMPAALNMLRRQGRLVFVGYSQARLSLNPLHLVLRETRILSSLGNTRQELRDVVNLAAQGKLHVPLAAEYPLEDAAGALAALRAGHLTGRAVLVPAKVPPLPSPAAAGEGQGEGTLVPRPSQWERLGEGTHSVPSRSRLPETIGSPHLASPIAMGEEHLESDLLAFVASPDDGEFEPLALRLFAHQYARNAPYRALCDRRGATPAGIATWRHIPPVPIAAFKEALLTCEPTDGAIEFNSSGTTKPERKSRHFHPNLRLYDLNAAANFKAHVLPNRERMPFLVLFPPREELPNSSLAHWLTLMVERWGEPGSAWYISAEGGLDAAAVVARLHQAEARGEAVGLLAASFGLVHFLEHCLDEGLRFDLPCGSRVMDTGGYKGRSREYTKADLYRMVTDLLNVPDSHIVNMYGMTEHGTQFLDTRLRDHLAGLDSPRHKSIPPWARTLVVDPETLHQMPSGERGLLLHFDLINRNSVLAVLSEDVGYAVDDGFELLGRAQGAEARGCSIALDELIQAVATHSSSPIAMGEAR